MVRKFAYVHRVVRISLLSKKITMCGYSVSLSQKQQQDKTLITKKKRLLYPAHRIHNGLQNGPKIFCRPKPPLHGLSFSKSPIIRVINRIKSCLTTIFHGIKFIHYHLYSEIPCNFLLYINYHIICQKLILHSIVKSCF